MRYRKFTRLKSYDYNTNGYYFVTICTTMRKPLLEIYKTKAEAILKEIPRRFTGVDIDFYSITSDHLHIIFTLNNTSSALGGIVRTFKALVTKSTGHKPFWEWNYYEHIIRDENALHNIRRYISENPLKEKINWEKIYSGINAAATKYPCNNTIHSAANNNQAPSSICSGAIYRANKGISLIIAVFAIMLFSVLGWTLVKIQSSDFESNVSTGNLNSERALNLAEAGAEWVLQRLNLNGGFRTDLANGYPSGYAQHSISPGQYRVSCLDGTGDDAGLVIITSNGYVPSASSYNTTRQVRLKIQVGSLTNALQTQVPDPDDQSVGLFDWSKSNNQPPVAPLHTVGIEGAIFAGHYNGDGDGTPDELNNDYKPPPAPLLPPDNPPAQNYQRGFTSAYPSINMQWFHDTADSAGQLWPDSNIPVTATIQSIADRNATEDCIIVTNATPAFFQNMDDDGAVRLDIANWYASPPANNQNNWRHIRSAGGGNCCGGFGNRCARVRNVIGTPGWVAGDTIRIMRRFGSNADDGSPGDIWYIGRQLDGGQPIETILDVNEGNLSLSNRYIISEGGIYIKGVNGLTMGLSGSGATTRYPRLATQSKDIISTDTPSGATEDARIGQRIISGLIYSELGEINLNYLRPLNTGNAAYRGNLVYGKRVTLDGRISINYLPGLVSTNGFNFAPGMTSWDEE